MAHDSEHIELSVRVDGEFEHVTEAEVVLIESYLGDLIQGILLTQDEKG